MQTKMGPATTLPTPKEAIQMIAEAFSFEEKTEEVALEEALGRVLAQDITAQEYIPSFNRSGMDGYSVIAADLQGASKETPIILPQAGEVLMGQAAEQPLQAGTCVYTPTGAAVPEGTEAVVMVEQTAKQADGSIAFCAEIEAGKNVVLKGDDVFPGKVVLEKGRVLNISDLGSFAAMGITRVFVSKKPVVGILSTGDELVDISAKPEGGQIRDINSTTLSLLVEQIGAQAKRYGIVKDETAALKTQVEKAIAECDMVLISGGSSMGEKDATEQIVEELGSLILHGIRMKPGKPTIIGKVGNKPVIGVPGHPVSAFFVTRIFVKKILQSMMHAKKEELFMEAVLDKDVKVNKERTVFHFAKIYAKDGVTHALPVKSQSSLITSMAGTDGLFAVFHDGEGVKAGETVTVHPL